MADLFLKVMKDQTASQFIAKHPKAFTLLYFIALRTNRTQEDCQLNGLEIGEAPIGDYETMGLTRAEYRAAIKRLTNNQQIATKTTNRGTIAKVISKAIIDINLEANDQQKTKTRPQNDQQTTTTKELRIKNKELKEINKENEEETFNPYWDTFKGVCITKNIEIDMTKKRYLELRDEYYTKLNWFNDSKACVEWCYDKGLKKINIQRLRNWMKNALRFQKEKEIKQLQHFQDKKFTPQPIKQSPIWTPPS